MKKSLQRRIRGGVVASGGVEALLLPALDPVAGPWTPASSFSSPAESTGMLTRELRRVA